MEIKTLTKYTGPILRHIHKTIESMNQMLNRINENLEKESFRNQFDYIFREIKKLKGEISNPNEFILMDETLEGEPVLNELKRILTFLGFDKLNNYDDMLMYADIVEKYVSRHDKKDCSLKRYLFRAIQINVIDYLNTTFKDRLFSAIAHEATGIDYVYKNSLKFYSIEHEIKEIIHQTLLTISLDNKRLKPMHDSFKKTYLVNTFVYHIIQRFTEVFKNMYLVEDLVMMNDNDIKKASVEVMKMTNSIVARENGRLLDPVTDTLTEYMKGEREKIKSLLQINA